VLTEKLKTAGFYIKQFPDVDGDVYVKKLRVLDMPQVRKQLFSTLEIEDSDIATIEVYPDTEVFISIWDLNSHHGPFRHDIEPGCTILDEAGVEL